jgi:hypothetical protein
MDSRWIPVRTIYAPVSTRRDQYHLAAGPSSRLRPGNQFAGAKNLPRNGVAQKPARPDPAQGQKRCTFAMTLKKRDSLSPAVALTGRSDNQRELPAKIPAFA